MINGHIDIGLILFQLGQYLMVFVAGYFFIRGFIDWVVNIKDYGIKKIDKELEYYEKKKKLENLRKEDAKEVDIPTLDECLKKDPHFLEHSEELPEPKNKVGQQDMHFGSKLDNIPHKNLVKNNSKKLGINKKGLLYFFSSNKNVK